MAVEKKTINLSRTYVYEGEKFGPGDVTITRTKSFPDPENANKMVTKHLADILEARDAVVMQQEADATKAAEDAKRAANTITSPQPGMITLSQDELKRLIKEGVNEAIASKSAKSMKSVSEEDDDDSEEESKSKSEEEDDDEEEEEEADTKTATPGAKPKAK